MSRFYVGLLGLLLSVSAHANTVDLKYVSPDVTKVTKVSISGSSFSGANVLMGSYNLLEQGAASTVSGFCVDPFQWANSNFKSYTKSDLDPTDFVNNGTTRFANAQKLFDNAYGLITGDATKTAGFHLVLWEIFHDDLNTASGIVKAMVGTDAGVLSYANTLLAGLQNWNVKGLYDITFYSNGKFQDYITATPSPVPLPAALPLLVSGLFGLGVMRRRKIA